MRVVDRRLASVVQMRRAMPNPITLANLDVIHLLRKKGVESGVPNSSVDVLGDGKRRGDLAGILNCVNAGIANAGKIKMRVLVAQPLSPRLDVAAKNLLVGTVRAKSQDA